MVYASFKYPYYLRIMRVAVSGVSDTDLPPSVREFLSYEEITIKEITGLASDIEHVVLRADLALLPYSKLSKEVSRLAKQIESPQLKKSVENRLLGIFSKYLPHLKEVHARLDPIAGALRRSANAWYDKYNDLNRELRNLTNVPRMRRRESRNRRAEIAQELSRLKVDDSVLVDVKKRLPKILGGVIEEFRELGSLAKNGSAESALDEEIENREEEAKYYKRGVDKLEESLNSMKENSGNSKEELRTYEELGKKYKLHARILEFKRHYVYTLKRAKEYRQLSVGVTAQASKAEKDIENLIDALPSFRAHQPIPEAENEPGSTPQVTPVSTENDNRDTAVPGRAVRPPPRRFPRPRMSSAQKRLSKVAKRLLIIDYLRHKSL